jgi:hypothetical protein
VAVCSVFALGTGNNVIVMFAIALASASLLATVGMQVGQLIMEPAEQAVW